MLISAFFVTIIFRIIGMIAKFGGRLFLGDHAEIRCTRQKVMYKGASAKLPKTSSFADTPLYATF